MRYIAWCALLLLTSGLPLMATGPLLAGEASIVAEERERAVALVEIKVR
ncbi:MAG: hypothetical protein AAF637_12155 [Pseudomonadota bacterium]